MDNYRNNKVFFFCCCLPTVVKNSTLKGLIHSYYDGFRGIFSSLTGKISLGNALEVSTPSSYTIPSQQSEVFGSLVRKKDDRLRCSIASLKIVRSKKQL